MNKLSVFDALHALERAADGQQVRVQLPFSLKESLGEEGFENLEIVFADRINKKEIGKLIPSRMVDAIEALHDSADLESFEIDISDNAYGSRVVQTKMVLEPAGVGKGRLQGGKG